MLRLQCGHSGSSNRAVCSSDPKMWLGTGQCPTGASHPCSSGLCRISAAQLGELCLCGALERSELSPGSPASAPAPRIHPGSSIPAPVCRITKPVINNPLRMSFSRAARTRSAQCLQNLRLLNWRNLEMKTGDREMSYQAGVQKNI